MFVKMIKIYDDSYYNPTRKEIVANLDEVEYIEKYDTKTYVHFRSGEKVHIEPIDINELNKI